MTPILSSITLSLALLTPANAQHQHDRANHAMGFDQARTTHHFRIETNGGTIEVTANDAKDQTSIDQIRGHLQHIARLFAKGDFNIPMLVHNELPPGANAMKARREALTYKYDSMPDGGKVVIRTNDAHARAAVHEFLRYQIREHHTGDPMDPR